MKEVVFDTETTGLPKNWAVKWHQDPSNWPDIMQFAAVGLIDGRPVMHQSFLMLTYDEPHPKAVETHGITKELTDAAGVPPDYAVDTIQDILGWADRIICHNAAFDMNVVLSFLLRQGSSEQALHSLRTRAQCTMRGLTDVMKLPGGRGGGWKFPTLLEAHQFLLGRPFEGAHDAMVDVAATSRVLRKMYERAIHPQSVEGLL